MTRAKDAVAAKPGRRAETPAQRIARLERDLEAARRAEKEAARRTFATIGAAIMEEAATDAEFNARVLDILRRRVVTKAGKADIAAVLATPTNEQREAA